MMFNKIMLIPLFLLVFLAFNLPDKPVKVLLAGDSTMANKPLDENPERGWGMYLGGYLQSNITVENHAQNGRSTQSFIKGGLWDKLLAGTSKGDFVFIQFGHNDSKNTDSNRYAAPQTTYRANLTRMVKDVQAKGANPVLLTPVVRRNFVNGKLIETHGEYPGVVRQLAAELKVPLIDVHTSSVNLLNSEGEAASKKLFLHIPEGHFANYKGKPEDNTHFSAYGAQVMASLVCQELKEKMPAFSNLLRKSDHPDKYVFELPKIYEPHFKKDTTSIVLAGANADGVTLNTKAIQQTIDAVAAKGGGVVMVPSGLWLTGPIKLKSNINLYLAPNATLQFTSDFEQYPIIEGNWEGEPSAVMQPPIWAKDAENIAITGKGIIDGNGDRMRMVKKDKLSESQWKSKVASGGVLDEKKRIWYPTEKSLLGSTLNKPWLLVPGKSLKDYEYIRDFLRPNLVVINNCSNILLEGVTFQNSTAWCLHPLMSRHLTVRNVMAKNPWYAQNGDGIDVESCSNVLIENSIFDVGDDALCMKSGRDASGRERAMPTKNVIIKNCVVYHAHGGFVVGSEMSGGVENVYVSHCTFLGTDIELRFKSTRGRGGVVKNIFINQISMRDIPGDAILFDLYYMAKDPVPMVGEVRSIPVVEFKPVDETTPIFKDIVIGEVFVSGAKKGIFIRGIPEMPVHNLVMKNMIIQSDKGIDCQEAKGVHFENIQLMTKETAPVIDVLNSRELRFSNIRYPNQSELLFRVSGDRCEKINIEETDGNNAKKKINFEFGASPKNIAIK